MTPLELDLSRVETQPQLPTTPAAHGTGVAANPSLPPASSSSSSSSSSSWSSRSSWISSSSFSLTTLDSDAQQRMEDAEATEDDDAMWGAATETGMRTEQREQRTQAKQMYPTQPRISTGQEHAPTWPPTPRQPGVTTYRYIFASGLLVRLSSLEEIETGPLPWWMWN